MALITFDGFDHYTQWTFNGVGYPVTSRWSVFSLSSSTPTFQAGRYGGRCFRVPSVTGTNFQARLSLGGSYSSFAFGCAVRFDNVGTWGAAGGGQNCFVLYDSAGAAQTYINFDSNGNAVVYRAPSTVLGVSSGRPLVNATWHYVECEIVISDTVGSVKMWVDETEVLNLTGIDTAATANLNVAAFEVLITTASSSAQQFDDFYFTDGTRLGEQVVIPLRPNADTGTKDFTPNSGTTNYTQVDDPSADNDSTYVQSLTVGHKDYYDFENLPSYAVDPKGVIAFVNARKTDAGVRKLRMNLKSSSSVSSSSDLILVTSYDSRVMQQLTDPNGGGAWTVSAINALQAGPEITV